MGSESCKYVGLKSKFQNFNLEKTLLINNGQGKHDYIPCNKIKTYCCLLSTPRLPRDLWHRNLVLFLDCSSSDSY